MGVCVCVCWDVLNGMCVLVVGQRAILDPKVEIPLIAAMRYFNKMFHFNMRVLYMCRHVYLNVQRVVNHIVKGLYIRQSF